MREIWSEQRKLEIWLKIELLATEALVTEGLVPKEDFEKMKSRAAFNLERAKELLVSTGVLAPQEIQGVNKVLDAAALTYVAAALQAVMTLLYYASILMGRRD